MKSGSRRNFGMSITAHFKFHFLSQFCFWDCLVKELLSYEMWLCVTNQIPDRLPLKGPILSKKAFVTKVKKALWKMGCNWGKNSAFTMRFNPIPRLGMSEFRCLCWFDPLIPEPEFWYRGSKDPKQKSIKNKIRISPQKISNYIIWNTQNQCLLYGATALGHLPGLWRAIQSHLV